MLFSRALIAVLALAAIFASPATHAQVYPAKQLRLVAPYPAGGGADFCARVIGAPLSLQSSPEEVSAYIKSETAKWAKVISAGKITVE